MAWTGWTIVPLQWTIAPLQWTIVPLDNQILQLYFQSCAMVDY